MKYVLTGTTNVNHFTGISIQLASEIGSSLGAPTCPVPSREPLRALSIYSGRVYFVEDMFKMHQL